MGASTAGIIGWVLSFTSLASTDIPTTPAFILDWIQAAIKQLLLTVVEGLWSIVEWLTVGIIEDLLYFPGTHHIPQLGEMYWGTDDGLGTFHVFWFILSVVGAAFFLFAQLFPEQDEASIDRFMQRVLVAVVMLFVVGFGFGYLIEAVNAVGQWMFPTEYRIDLSVAFNSIMMSEAGQLGGFAIGAILFAFLAGPKILLTYGIFLMVLGMRMVIVYMTYAMFPILIAFWIVDIGPAKYGKMVSGYIFKVTMMLLLFGIVLSGILGVGGAIASGEVGGSAAVSSEQLFDGMYEPPEQSEDRTIGGTFDDSPDAFPSPADTSLSAWFQIFAFFAALWMCIGLTAMVMGSTISTGAGRNMKKAEGSITKMKQGYRDRMSSSGGGGAEAGSRGDGNGHTGQTGGEETDSGDGQDEEVSEDTGAGEDAPEPENPETSLGDKASHLDDKYLGGRGGRAKQAAGEAVGTYKNKAEAGADKMGRKASETGDSVEDSMTQIGEHLGGTAGGYVGKGVGKVANAGVTAVGNVPKGAMKGGNLAKRGGKAYWNVFKQPDVGSSIGEAHRIARESPIGHPNKPGETRGDSSSASGSGDTGDAEEEQVKSEAGGENENQEDEGNKEE